MATFEDGQAVAQHLLDRLGPGWSVEALTKQEVADRGYIFAEPTALVRVRMARGAVEFAVVPEDEAVWLKANRQDIRIDFVAGVSRFARTADKCVNALVDWGS